MSKTNLYIKPSRLYSLGFDDMQYEPAEYWEQKARALQVRRWRALQREIKGKRSYFRYTQR